MWKVWKHWRFAMKWNCFTFHLKCKCQKQDGLNLMGRSEIKWFRCWLTFRCCLAFILLYFMAVICSSLKSFTHIHLFSWGRLLLWTSVISRVLFFLQPPWLWHFYLFLKWLNNYRSSCLICVHVSFRSQISFILHSGLCKHINWGNRHQPGRSDQQRSKWWSTGCFCPVFYYCIKTIIRLILTLPKIIPPSSC